MPFPMTDPEYAVFAEQWNRLHPEAVAAKDEAERQRRTLERKRDQNAWAREQGRPLPYPEIVPPPRQRKGPGP